MEFPADQDQPPLNLVLPSTLHRPGRFYDEERLWWKRKFDDGKTAKVEIPGLLFVVLALRDFVKWAV
jgi:hypothetical protein